MTHFMCITFALQFSYISRDLVKVRSVVQVATFNKALKCRGKSCFAFIVQPLEAFMKIEVALK